jgi:multidrug transporter EmrE-like cation transporter
MGYVFLAVALALNATANVLLKVGAARLGDLTQPGLLGRLLTEYHLLAGVLLFALNVVFYVAALTRLNLSVAYPTMVAGGIVIVVSTSVVFLREPLTPAQALGLILLILGIGLIGHRWFA